MNLLFLKTTVATNCVENVYKKWVRRLLLSRVLAEITRVWMKVAAVEMEKKVDKRYFRGRANSASIGTWLTT